MCGVLEALESAVTAVPGMPSPVGLGAAEVLHEQVDVLAGTVAVLQRELSLRMAALEQQSSRPTDTRGDAVRRGLGQAQAARLRRFGVFAVEHESVGTAWRGGLITVDQVGALQGGAAQLPTPAMRQQLVEHVLQLLPGLGASATRRLVEYTVDQLDPGNPDQEEQSDYAERFLAWSRAPQGGLLFQGYLPKAEADAFTRAIDALVEHLRVAGDGVGRPQRRADALAELVAVAGRHGLPSGGGLPATLTLTVSLTEAERIAQRDPAEHGTEYGPRRRGSATMGDRPAGDAAVRFGLCCAAVSPVLGDPPQPGSALHRIAEAKVEPLAVGRSVRLATPAQRRALEARDQGCAIPGCAVGAAYTQPHHVTPWSLDGATDLDNLVSLCFVHHRQVELGRFTFVRKQDGCPGPKGAIEHPLWWIVTPRRAV